MHFAFCNQEKPKNATENHFHFVALIVTSCWVIAVGLDVSIPESSPWVLYQSRLEHARYLLNATTFSKDLIVYGTYVQYPYRKTF